MAEEGKGVALAILGVVAVIAVVGLVLLFTGATAKVSMPFQKVYGGVNVGEESLTQSITRKDSTRKSQCR